MDSSSRSTGTDGAMEQLPRNTGRRECKKEEGGGVWGLAGGEARVEEKKTVKFMRTVRKVMEEMGFVPFDTSIS